MGLVDVALAETLPKGVCNPANGEKISVKRAIELGIINPRTGEVRNPFSNERLSWVDLTKSVYKSLTMDGVYDPKKGYSVSVTSALNDGLIDAKTEQYHNPITGDRFSLEDATNKGLIDQVSAFGFKQVLVTLFTVSITNPVIFRKPTVPLLVHSCPTTALTVN